MRRLLFLLCVFPVVALGQDMPPLKYFAEIPGHCLSLEKNGSPLGKCKDVVFNFAYQSNRTSFFFFTEEHSIIAFSGGKDEQPSRQEYRLEISNLNIDQQQIAARGSCDVHGDIASESSDMVCEAITLEQPAVTYRAVFKTDGKPVVHRH